MILSDGTLRERLHEFISEGRDPDLINPASIDIRIGREMLLEGLFQPADDVHQMGKMRVSTVKPPRADWGRIDLSKYTAERPFHLPPRAFALVATYEWLRVPNGYAMEMKLKSSRAREGYNHSLAFWFDPGWDGIGTMEIQNVTQHHTLPLYCGFRFAQIIIHELDKPAVKPYAGRYNGAPGVERSKA